MHALVCIGNNMGCMPWCILEIIILVCTPRSSVHWNSLVWLFQNQLVLQLNWRLSTLFYWISCLFSLIHQTWKVIASPRLCFCMHVHTITGRVHWTWLTDFWSRLDYFFSFVLCATPTWTLWPFAENPNVLLDCRTNLNMIDRVPFAW